MTLTSLSVKYQQACSFIDTYKNKVIVCTIVDIGQKINYSFDDENDYMYAL